MHKIIEYYWYAYIKYILLKINENIRQCQTYINSIDICKDNVRLNVVDVKLNESIFSMLNKVYNIIGTIISKKMENKLLKGKSKCQRKGLK